MNRTKGQKFSDKHSPEATVNNLIKDKVLAHAKSGELACAVAFKIGGEINKPPAEIGKTVDLMDFKLVKCQLGLFGINTPLTENGLTILLHLFHFFTVIFILKYTIQVFRISVL